MAKDGICLTKEQQQVVQYRGGHLLVVASAGAGKTEAISRRIVSLLEDGVEPGQIVAFTFTEKAAAGLKTRIYRRTAQQKGEPFLEKMAPMYVGTIHAYCLRVLQEQVPEYAAYDMIDEHRLAALLSREYKRLKMDALGAHGHWANIGTFLSNADVVENELIPLAALGDDIFGQVYTAYVDMLDRYRVFTFGQLITKVVAALQDKRTYGKIHNRLRHLVVDEYQDINPAQEKLIELLSQKPVQVCVVGDDDQAIYQWRGSSVDNFINFEKKYGAHKIELRENHRSMPRIIERANAFAASITPRIIKSMEPVRQGDGPEFHTWSAPTPSEEAELVASTIKDLHKLGYRYRDIGILLRSVRTSSEPFIHTFEDKGIPYQCAGRTGLFLQSEAQLFGKTMTWLAGNTEWRSAQYDKASQHVDLEKLLKEYQTVFGLKKAQKDKLSQYLLDWQKDAGDDSVTADLITRYYDLLLFVGVQNWDLTDPVTVSRTGVLARFSELLADYENSRRRSRWVVEDGVRSYRGGTLGGIWYYRNLHIFIQWYCVAAFEDYDGSDQFEVDAVNLSTIHQAKGLEWPVVFVPALVKGRFPSSMMGRTGTWWVSDTLFPKRARSRYQGSDADERRLFYVAITRARDMLYASRFKAMKNNKGNSPYLGELAKGDPQVQDEAMPLPPRYTPQTHYEDDRPVFSFSDLARYERCPYAYRLSALLGFQPPLVEEMGYGKAIHHALRRVADFYLEHGKVPDKKDVEKMLDAEFFIPHARKPAYDALRQSAGALVERYLQNYTDDLKRIWETERSFELQLGGSIVIGRADVILDRETGKKDTLAIVDYKTATAAVSDDIFAFQLAVYTAAARGEGLVVEAAYLHDLKSAERKPVPVSATDIDKARKRADGLATRIIGKDFTPCPGKNCKYCDVRQVCGHGR